MTSQAQNRAGEQGEEGGGEEQGRWWSSHRGGGLVLRWRWPAPNYGVAILLRIPRWLVLFILACFVIPNICAQKYKWVDLFLIETFSLKKGNNCVLAFKFSIETFRLKKRRSYNIMWVSRDHAGPGGVGATASK